MTEELARHQYRLSATDLHTAFDELVKEGLLNADHRLIDGHQQWIYRGTPSGRMELARDLRALSKLSHEVFGDALPAAPLDMETVPLDHSVLGDVRRTCGTVEPSVDNERMGWEFGYR